MVCHICNEKKTEFLFETYEKHGAHKISNEKFVILICPSCRLVFPGVRPQKNFYQRYYSKNYYEQGNSLFTILGKIYSKFITFYIKVFISRLKKEGEILDFGCGRGHFLQSLPSSFGKTGVEINSQARKYIKDNYSSISVFNSLEESKLKNKKFDLITLWHVIEHIDSPKDTMKKLSDILKPKGNIIITTPNSHSWSFSLTKSHWFHLDAPRHLGLFNLQNLTALTEELKLKLVSVKYPLLEYPLDVFWSLYNSFKSKFGILNIFLAVLLFPLSAVIKLIYSFIPQSGEVLLLVLRKK